MLPREITELLEEVFEFFSEKERDEVKKQPEVYLVSLLSKIKEDLPEVSSMLKFTVESAAYCSSLDRAREKFNRKEKKSQKTLAKSR